MDIPERVAARAATRAIVEGECLTSTYSVASHGYAQVGWTESGMRTMTTAHRAAYVFWTGQQIPDGMTVDHTCHNRRCVRRVHLRLLSNPDNGRRNGPDRDYEVGQSCRRNHPASARVRTSEGHLICHECRLVTQAEFRQRRRKA